MALVEKAEEGGFGGMMVPALADEGGMDEGGGEAEADDDLPQEVVVVGHLGYLFSTCGHHIRIILGDEQMLITFSKRP